MNWVGIECCTGGLTDILPATTMPFWTGRLLLVRSLRNFGRGIFELSEGLLISFRVTFMMICRIFVQCLFMSGCCLVFPSIVNTHVSSSVVYFQLQSKWLLHLLAKTKTSTSSTMATNLILIPMFSKSGTLSNPPRRKYSQPRSFTVRRWMDLAIDYVLTRCHLCSPHSRRNDRSQSFLSTGWAMMN